MFEERYYVKLDVESFLTFGDLLLLSIENVNLTMEKSCDYILTDRPELYLMRYGKENGDPQLDVPYIEMSNVIKNNQVEIISVVFDETHLLFKSNPKQATSIQSLSNLINETKDRQLTSIIYPEEKPQKCCALCIIL